ncbi:Glutathione synthase substrate-binding eukaryotic [Trinorchestia longiramus]|nr:Glutathione synthase substrate-binding eukaryotic [Trinorchestia longiramus]
MILVITLPPLTPHREGEHEVGVVYFRFGYDPSCYHGDQDWQARLLIERSLAIKSPSIHYHLAGTKKVQQELAAEGALLQFLSPAEATQVSELFTGLYSLDVGEEGDKAVAMALHDPSRFVLKPQREGGGNNLYGDDITKTLEKVGHKPEREAYILMERIKAPVQQNYLVRPHSEPELASVMSELGIFGAVMGTASHVTLNRTCGHMLRSKLASNNEGGVASGNGALDSVLLVDA